MDITKDEARSRVGLFALNALAQIEEFKWEGDFCKEQAIKTLQKARKFLQEQDIDFCSMTEEELLEWGFRRWSDEDSFLLVPLWAYHLLPKGTKLYSINGDTEVKGIDDIDLDVRFGVIAHGIIPGEKPVPEEVDWHDTLRKEKVKSD